jgi:hypothetical protein
MVNLNYAKWFIDKINSNILIMAKLFMVKINKIKLN